MVLQSKKRFAVTLLVNISRLVLAVVLIVSGFVKAVDPVGTMYKLQEYASVFSLDTLSNDWLLFFAIVQAAMEFLLGVFMLTGIYRKVVPLFSMMMLLCFTPLSYYIMSNGSLDDCGCFGDAVELDNNTTFYKNLVLLFLSFLVFWKRRRFSLYISSKNRWLVVLFSFFYISVLQGVSLSFLPVLDFRPYAEGNNLRELTQGTLDEYAVYYLCEKDGVQQEFLQDNMPDSSWSVLSSRSEVVTEGKKPVIGDFSIIDWEYDYDIAEEILADTGYVCLVVIEKMEEAAVSRIDKVNDLYDYCLENAVPFYAATSSSDEEIELWRKRTGAEYPICWADESLLRRIIRANPGLLLLKDGVIVSKWNASDIPSVEEIADSPTKMPDKVDTLFDHVRGWRFWVNCFLWPLAFIALVDVFSGKAKRKKARAASEKGIQPVSSAAGSEVNDKSESGHYSNNDI